jgi:hypothetical protein
MALATSLGFRVETSIHFATHLLDGLGNGASADAKGLGVRLQVTKGRDRQRLVLSEGDCVLLEHVRLVKAVDDGTDAALVLLDRLPVEGLGFRV